VVRELARAEQVAAPQLDPFEAQPAGGDVEQLLARGGALVPAGRR
jgi:hypothetical protein